MRNEDAYRILSEPHRIDDDAVKSLIAWMDHGDIHMEIPYVQTLRTDHLISGREHLGMSIGHVATRIRNGHHILNAWIRRGGDVHARTTFYDETIGMHAAMFNASDCYRVWLDAGGDRDARDRYGRNLGHVWALHGHHTMDPSWMREDRIHQTTTNGTTIGHACWEYGKNPEWFLAWLEAGGKACSMRHDGDTIGHLMGHIGADAASIVAWMHHGGDPMSLDAQGRTMVDRAIQRGHDDTAMAVLGQASPGDRAALERQVGSLVMDEAMRTASYADGRSSHMQRIIDVVSLGIPVNITGDPDSRRRLRSVLSSRVPRHALLKEVPDHFRTSFTTAAEPRMQVMLAAMQVWDGQPISRRQASMFRRPEGRAMAERMIPMFTDPLHLATWLQAMA
jgi:hypothetical protein